MNPSANRSAPAKPGGPAAPATTPGSRGCGRSEALKAIAALLCLATSLPAFAENEIRTVVSASAGECSLSLEADEEWHALRLRAQHPRYRACEVSEAAVTALLASAFAQTGASALKSDYVSLSLGRLVDYPWLSTALAKAARHDKGWNSKKGRPVNREINRYTAGLLFNRKMLKPFEAGLAGPGYRIDGVAVEKVLVGKGAELPGYSEKGFRGRLPFDAQVWLTLTKTGR